MASTPKFYDRVLETTTVTSTTSPLTLLGAVTGYQSWAAVGNGNSAQYCIEAVDASGIPNGKWEVGVGTYTSSGTTLSRTTILASSNSGSIESFDAGTKRVHLVGPVAASAVPVFSDWGGRLTLESGVPVSTTDQLAKSHLFYTPYQNNITPKWNGSSWERVVFAEYDLTLTLTAANVYDVWWNGSALSLSAAWTGNSRNDALATQDGVPCLSSDHTKLHVGTIYASTTNQTADSQGGTSSSVGGTRFVWNRYNQVRRYALVVDTTATPWQYTTNTWRQERAQSGNKIEYVTGDAAMAVDATNVGSVYAAASTAVMEVGVGVDSTTAPSGLVQAGYCVGAGNATYSAVAARYSGYPGLGYHYVAALEKGGTDGGGASRFIGSNGDGQQTGLVVALFM